MKKLLLIFLIIMTSLVFASDSFQPNFELVQSSASNGRMNPNTLVIPVKWFKTGGGFPNVRDEFTWTKEGGFVNTTIDSGVNIIQLGDDPSGFQFGQIAQEMGSLSYPVTITFYMNINNLGNEEFVVEVYNDTAINSMGFRSNGSVYCDFDLCMNESIGAGWQRIELRSSRSIPVTDIGFSIADSDGSYNFVLVDGSRPSQSVLNPQPATPAPINQSATSIPPPTPAPLQSTTSSLSLVSLLFVALVIVLVIFAYLRRRRTAIASSTA